VAVPGTDFTRPAFKMTLGEGSEISVANPSEADGAALETPPPAQPSIRRTEVPFGPSSPPARSAIFSCIGRYGFSSSVRCLADSWVCSGDELGGVG